ncbi:hypothetical protein, partial [Roseateles sp. P5_E11]
MSVDTSEYWNAEPFPPLLLGAVAPLTAVVLSLVALWIAAMPNPTHTVAVDIGGCARLIEQSSRKPVTHT